jgi:hypothetical protein
MRSTVLSGIEAPPLITWPAGAGWFAFLIWLASFAILFFAAMRIKNLDASIGILICSSILLSPLAWSQYLILILIPLAVIFKMIDKSGNKTNELSLFAIIGLLLFFCLNVYDLLLLGKVNNTVIKVSFWVSLLTLIPNFGLMVVVWFINRIEKLNREVNT